MFSPYSPSHLVVLAIFVAGIVALLVAGAQLRGAADKPGENRGTRRMMVALAVANVVFGVASTLTALVPFSARDSLPLQICDLAWVFVAWGLLTLHPLATSLTYYWGLTLSLQALLQPTLTEPFPDPEFFVFWAKHVLIVWGAVYLTICLRHGPDWAAYRRAVAWTFGWLVAVVCLNAVLDSNYGYVSAKPSESTVLDLLGPWPLFLLVEMLIVAGGWAVITLPWTGRPRWAHPVR
jgi:hypothetical integral membrane protein (TIGR02206 family)